MVCLSVLRLVLIIFSYVAMFLNIQQTRRNTPLAVREVDVALRFFCIVATDSLCWTPIIVTKILVLLGVDIPSEFRGPPFSWVRARARSLGWVYLQKIQLCRNGRLYYHRVGTDF